MERADVFRYLVLDVHGGYYADVDVECRAAIKDYQAGLVEHCLERFGDAQL